MHEQEKTHLKKFSDLMVRYRVRPTILLPFWNVVGYALGKANLFSLLWIEIYMGETLD